MIFLSAVEINSPQVLLHFFQEELRVGINWSVHPDKMWPNNTVPYAISPLYRQFQEPSTLAIIY